MPHYGGNEISDPLSIESLSYRTTVTTSILADIIHAPHDNWHHRGINDPEQ
jgi:hypothetical protein